MVWKQKIFLYFALLFSLPVWGETSILILHSYHAAYPWTKVQNQSFMSVLDNAPNLYPFYSTEYLDTKRRTMDQEYEEEFVHYLQSKYKGYQPSLIYVTDDNALHFMLHHKMKLFSSVPVVFSGVNDLSKRQQISENGFTGIFETKVILPNLKLIERLFPNEHEVFVIGDGTITSHAIHNSIDKELAAYHGLNVRYCDKADLETILSRLHEFKGKTIILTTIGAFRDHKGKLLTVQEVIHRIQRSGNFFLFSLEDTYIQNGVIGGYAVDGISQGAAAGRMALNLLKNPKNPLSRKEVDTNGWIFDASSLKDYGINLPEEIKLQVRYVNLPPTFYQTHETLITDMIYILGGLLLVGSSLFVFFLYRNHRMIRQREEALSILTERLNKAQSIAHIGNWEWEIETGALWWSNEIYRIFGLESQQFIPSYDAFLACVHPEDREIIQGAIDRALLLSTDYRVGHRIIQPDGTIRHVIEEGTFEVNAVGTPVKMAGTVRDVTEEYEYTQALSFQAHIFDAVQDSIMVYDPDDGRFIYLNDNAWKTRAYTKKEMMEMRVYELEVSANEHEYPEVMQSALEQMEIQGWVQVEVEHLCKDGRRFPVEIFSKKIIIEGKVYVLSSVRDISERKETQRILETSEKKYRDLVENAMIGVYRSNLSGRILYVNSALVTMLGYESAEELIGQRSVIAYKNERERETLIRKITSEHHISNYEIDLINHQGDIVPVMLSATLEGETLSGMISDMREIKKSRESIEKFSTIVEQFDDSVVITDANGIITYANPAFYIHTGFTEKEVLGKTSRICKSGQHDKAFYEKMWGTILAGDVFRGTFVNRKKNGEIYHENKTITPIKDDMDKVIGFVSSGKDVTSEVLLNQETHRKASTDKLTGIYNRYKFEELFILESERARRFSLPLSLIVIDIDHFKSVNDTYGHDVGDMVLIYLANIIRENTRKIDVFARWGGEEFVVLCPGTDLEKVRKLAEKIRFVVENASFLDVGHITVSLGISSCVENDSFSALFKRADQGLYNAKANGRNRVESI